MSDFAEKGQSPDLPKAHTAKRRDEILRRLLAMAKQANKEESTPETHGRVQMIEAMLANGLTFSQAASLIQEGLMQVNAATARRFQPQ